MRRVLLSEQYAIKFPRRSNWESGIAANRSEIAWSAKSYPDFCPVLCSHPSGLWLVMPKCRVMTDSDMSEHDFEKFYMAFGDDLFDQGIDLPTIEAKRNSFGWYRGRWVAIDYGDW